MLLKVDVKQSELEILPLPDTGDLSYWWNYKGINLSSFVADTVNKMVFNRLKIKTDGYLQSNQNSFTLLKPPQQIF